MQHAPLARQEPACRVLEEHYRNCESWDDLVRINRAQLGRLEDPYERQQLLRQMASVQEGSLDDSQGAFDSLALALGEVGCEPDVLGELDRLSISLGSQGQLAELYEAQVSASLNEELGLPMHRRLARMYQGQFGAPQQAVGHWDAVLATEGYDVEALGCLDRLHTTQRNWASLTDVLRRRVDVAENGHSHAIRCRLGRLLEVVEGDVTGAIEMHSVVLGDDPENELALTELERLVMLPDHRNAVSDILDGLYRDGGNWKKLAILQELRVEATEDPVDQAALWSEAAQLREEELSDPETALDNLFLGLHAAPTDDEIRESVVRLGTAQNRWSELAVAFERSLDGGLDLDTSLLVRTRVAEWCREQLHDDVRAQGHYSSILEVDPENGSALRALEEIHQKSGSWTELAAVYRREIESTFEPDEKRERLGQLARLQENQLADRAGAIESFLECLAIDDEDAEAIESLERLYEEGAEWSALADLQTRRSANCYDEELLLGILGKLGAICREQLGEPERAIEAFERILEVQPEHAAAIGALLQMYASAERWPELHEVPHLRIDSKTLIIATL